MEAYVNKLSLSCIGYQLKFQTIYECLNLTPNKPIKGETVNVFINLECVLKNLAMQKGLNSIIEFHKQNVILDMESSILNLMAHYRMYFEKEK